jgi:DNA transformation protein
MAEEGLVEWVAEALQRRGVVTSRQMMGGRTIYCDGIIFAIAVQGELYFKADVESDAIWDAAGADRFVYREKDGKPQSMNYRQAPSDVYDDPDALCEWAEVAIAAGGRGQAKKRRK